ncbi:hypothetical protein [Salmonella enterica]|uniref:hypothetical protein n=1 Tax=Salmonella enterica TaxID=28901 RepID=UPI00215ABAB4|nr:hypothetical protein [Salmonella enterica]
MNNKLTDETLKAWKTEAMISLGETPKDCRDYSHHEAILALVTELQELRAAMLQGTEPVSQTYNLPELIEGMEVSIDVSTCDADAGNRYFGTVTEVSELYTAKNGYILLVQDAEPNFDVNGNSPVIPDGYALVPVEPTDEMIAAAMNCEDVLFNSDESFCVQFGNIYEAMLAAAPKPEANNG